MKYFLRALLVFGFILSLFFSRANACSCSEITALDMLNFEFNKYIFIGIVTSAKLMKHEGAYSYVVADVEVEERFKGLADERKFNVSTNLSDSSCGGTISVGARYIFVTDARGFFTFCTSMSIEPRNIDEKTRVYIKDFRDLANLK